MKPWKLLPKLKLPKSLRMKRLGEKGQSIVEFVLLLAVITGLSYSFVAIMNKNIARYWEYSANLIVNDGPSDKKAVSLE